MCGIFAYVNHLVEKDRNHVINTLLNGLACLEYRGYDSAGLAIDGDRPGETLVFKQTGKVAMLRNKINQQNIDRSKILVASTGVCLSNPDRAHPMGDSWPPKRD
jgi:glucosamine--fructose-6-phosphate aminotransferase (isomerizing)